jgi:hypothetical protein
MIRLLDSCIRTLADHGMRNLFIDAVKWGDQGFQELGTWHCIQAYWAAAKPMVRLPEMGCIQRGLARYLTQSEVGAALVHPLESVLYAYCYSKVGVLAQGPRYGPEDLCTCASVQAVRCSTIAPSSVCIRKTPVLRNQLA